MSSANRKSSFSGLCWESFDWQVCPAGVYPGGWIFNVFSESRLFFFHMCRRGEQMKKNSKSEGGEECSASVNPISTFSWCKSSKEITSRLTHFCSQPSKLKCLFEKSSLYSSHGCGSVSCLYSIRAYPITYMYPANSPFKCHPQNVIRMTVP